MNFLEERIMKDGVVKEGKCPESRQFPEPSDGYSPVE